MSLAPRTRAPILLLLLGGCAGGPKPATTPGTGTPTPPTTVPSTGTTTSPTGPEICDGLDNDGDGEVDEEGGPTRYRDADFDGFGDPTQSTTACDPGLGWVEDDTDCDDTNAAIFPTAQDVCDGLDNDCDLDVDEDHRVGWFLGTLDQGWVHRIDTLTGVTTPEYDMGITLSPDINSTDLFEASFGVAHQSQDGVLWAMDVCAGQMIPIGPTYAGNIGGIAFGPNGRLFGFSHGDDAIYELDLSTGQATLLAPIGFDAGTSGMAYDCTHGTLYALDTTSDDLSTIDPITGLITSTTPLTQDLGGSMGLEFDHRDGTLLAAGNTNLYRIDPATGQTTLLTPVSGLANLDDLAFFPPCP